MFTTASTHSIEDQNLHQVLFWLIYLWKYVHFLFTPRGNLQGAKERYVKVASTAGGLYMSFWCSIHAIFSNNSIHVKSPLLRRKMF